MEWVCDLAETVRTRVAKKPTVKPPWLGLLINKCQGMFVRVYRKRTTGFDLTVDNRSFFPKGHQNRTSVIWFRNSKSPLISRYEILKFPRKSYNAFIWQRRPAHRWGTAFASRELNQLTGRRFSPRKKSYPLYTVHLVGVAILCISSSMLCFPSVGYSKQRGQAPSPACFTSDSLRIQLGNVLFKIPRGYGPQFMGPKKVRDGKIPKFCQTAENPPFNVDWLRFSSFYWDPDKKTIVYKNTHPFQPSLVFTLSDAEKYKGITYFLFAEKMKRIGKTKETISQLPTVGDFFFFDNKAQYYVSPKEYFNKWSIDLLFACDNREILKSTGELWLGRRCQTYTLFVDGIYLELLLRKQGATADPKDWRLIHFQVEQLLRSMIDNTGTMTNQ